VFLLFCVFLTGLPFVHVFSAQIRVFVDVWFPRCIVVLRVLFPKMRVFVPGRPFFLRFSFPNSRKMGAFVFPGVGPRVRNTNGNNTISVLN
jgi:hypothetical protein